MSNVEAVACSETPSDHVAGFLCLRVFYEAIFRGCMRSLKLFLISHDGLRCGSPKHRNPRLCDDYTLSHSLIRLPAIVIETETVEMQFSGKRAIVLGGTSGIGLAVANQLASAGAEVTAVSRNPDRAATSVADGVQLHACDVRDRSGLETLFRQGSAFDFLVCAATGGERARGPFLEMDLDGYQASFDKLWGYTNAVRLGTPHMSQTASIVLVSGAPARRAKPGQIALASVGGAVEAFCRAVAPELAPRRINVVSPGVIDTPMFGDDLEARQKTLAAATATHLLPRPGTPDEVAQAIVFLLQNEFVTGTTIDVDGGWLLT